MDDNGQSAFVPTQQAVIRFRGILPVYARGDHRLKIDRTVSDEVIESGHVIGIGPQARLRAVIRDGEHSVRADDGQRLEL